MKLLGYEISRQQGIVSIKKAVPTGLQSVSSQSWWPNWWGGRILESYSGAWQQNVVVDSETSLVAFSAVFSCVTGIASDIAKMRIKLMEIKDGLWTETKKPLPWLPVLRKPNHYQTRLKFIEQWIVSKLLHGNTYVLKQRADKRGIVTALYILDPTRVTPLIAEDGSVYYELKPDDLSQVEDTIIIPASEIIHDTMVCLWHPLIGVSPIYACGVSATMGNKIQADSTNLHANRSMPGGMLTAPGQISEATAARLKAKFETNFGGANVGRILVGGDGLKFEPFIMSSRDSQMLEQLQWTVQDVGRAFHYPEWKMGGALPPYSNGPEALTMMYYTDCLQGLIESLEVCLDEGLELGTEIGTEMDLDNLMRMDTQALYESNNKAEKWMKVDEMRFRANLAPITGGNTVYRQHQDYSIEALARRDKKDDPFAVSPAPTKESTAEKPQEAMPPPENVPAPEKGMDLEDVELLSEAKLRKELCLI